MKDCVLYLNVSKEKLYDYEILSLNRTLDLYLGSDICDIMLHIPNTIDTNILFNYLRSDIKERVHNNNLYISQDNPLLFQSVNGYNNMLLTNFLYNDMSKKYKYKYMFIVQIDAFVFNDMLKYYIDKNYDYIGSYEYFLYRSSNSLIGNINNEKYMYLNGGFSLRNIDKCIEAVNNYCVVPEYLETHILFDTLINTTYFAEDSFFSQILNQNNIDIKDLIMFGYSSLSSYTVYPLNKYRYPFGCHGIQKSNLLKQLINNFMEENNINYNNIRL